uniref:C-type lectin domain-containing protein n=1 Tax=Oreochromis aureus TaxID=47969 RepID=A0AAZ1WYU7_OREAU
MFVFAEKEKDKLVDKDVFFVLLFTEMMKNNKTFHLIKTWDEARAYCREKYTDLAKVFDLTDMRRLQDSAQNQTEAWIGLYSEPGRDNRRWHWSLPGEEYTENETCWEAGEPNDGAYPENCVMKKDKWADYSCTSKFQFICYDGENMWTVT